MKRVCLLFVFSIYCCCLSSQSTSHNKEPKWKETELKQLEKAELLLSEKNYKLALPIYEKLLSNHPEDLKLKYAFATCGMLYPGLQQTSLDYLLEVYSKNKKVHQIEFTIAKAYYHNNQFTEALKWANSFSAKNIKVNQSLKKEMADFIKVVSAAQKMAENPVTVTITNMGAPINSSAAETAPCLSESSDNIIFTYKGEKSVGGLQNPFNQPDKNGLYFEDIYQSKKINNVWQEPVGAKNLNTKNNDAVLCLSNDGTEMYLSIDSPKDDGDIYKSKFENGDWSLPVKLIGPINSADWEDNCSLSQDGKTMFFVSNRPGGFGGKDIYQASLLKDGSWGNIKNLGDKINTPLDDDAPFIHFDGRLFLFSSKGHNSIGGYDIFKSYLNLKDSTWSVPENLGYPINSANDDNHYELSTDGETAFYSIGKSDGMGDFDIYQVTPGITGVMPAVAVVEGNIKLDTLPVKASVVIEIPSKNRVYKKIETNALTGHYKATLPLGEDYKVVCTFEKREPKTESFFTSNIKEYIKKNIDFNFVTPKDTSLTAQLNSNLNNVLDSVIDGLEYHIQVATHTISRRLKRKLKREFSEVKMDMINNEAKYTLKEGYTTLRKARLEVEKVKSLVPDAFIVGYYKENRYHLYELRQKGILPLKE